MTFRSPSVWIRKKSPRLNNVLWPKQGAGRNVWTGEGGCMYCANHANSVGVITAIKSNCEMCRIYSTRGGCGKHVQ